MRGYINNRALDALIKSPCQNVSSGLRPLLTKASVLVDMLASNGGHFLAQRFVYDFRRILSGAVGTHFFPPYFGYFVPRRVIGSLLLLVSSVGSLSVTLVIHRWSLLRIAGVSSTRIPCLIPGACLSSRSVIPISLFVARWANISFLFRR